MKKLIAVFACIVLWCVAVPAYADTVFYSYSTKTNHNSKALGVPSKWTYRTWITCPSGGNGASGVRRQHAPGNYLASFNWQNTIDHSGTHSYGKTLAFNDDNVVVQMDTGAGPCTVRVELAKVT